MIKEFFSATTRRIVMLAVGLAVLPPLILGVYSGALRYYEAQEDLERHSLRVVRSVADRHRLLVENAQAILAALQSASLVRESAAVSSAELFRDVIASYPVIDNIFLLSSSGELVSSALPFLPGATPQWPALASAGKDWDAPIIRAVRNSVFTGAPVLQVTMPVGSSSRSGFRGRLGLELELIFFEGVFAEVETLPGAYACILGTSGNLLNDSLSGVSPGIGEPVGDALWKALSALPEKSGSFAQYMPSGVKEHVFFERLPIDEDGERYFTIVLKVPESVALNGIFQDLTNSMFLLVLSGIYAGVVGMAFCYVGFSRPVAALVAVSGRLEQGESAARVENAASMPGEYKELAYELNSMAAALEERNCALEQARAAAQLSSKAKSEFLANMSHEIRTPMNGILGMAHLVAGAELNESQKLQVEKIHAEAEGLLRLINNILDYSRIEAGKMPVENIPFHLGFILKNVRAAGLEAARRSGAGIVSDIPSSMPARLIGSPALLSQALSLILREAVRCSGGGTVEIGGTAEDNTGRDVTLYFTKVVRNMHLLPDALARLQELADGTAEQTARLETGELGMMLAGSIMRLLGGNILVENNEAGLCFTGVIRLAIERTPFQAGAEAVFPGERVLCVFADAEKGAAMRALLGRRGLNGVWVESAEAALQALSRAADEDPFRLVLVHEDCCVPGALVLEGFGGDGMRLPVVVLLAEEMPGKERLSAEEYGAEAVFPYPLSEVFLSSVLTLLPGGEEIDVPTLQASAPVEDRPQRFDGVSVLLAEDNIVNQEIAREILEGWGIAVTLAGNGEEAVAQCVAEPGTFDLVLMDLEMPGMGGLEATRALRRHSAALPWKLPIIAMTAHNDADDAAECIEAGMNEHTVKPIVVEQLAAVIARWLPVRGTPESGTAELLFGLGKELERTTPDAPQLELYLRRLRLYLGRGRTEMLKTYVERGDRGEALRMLEDFMPSDAGASGAGPRQGGPA